MDVPCPPEWRPAPGVVHVATVRVDRPIPGALDVLDDAERARAARFAFDHHRARFILAHAWLRRLLGEYVGQPPASLRFTAAPGGKPRLLNEGTDVRFSLSHAGDLALIAAAPGIELGVDIEDVGPADRVDLARRFFAPGEVAALETLPVAEQSGAFVRGWTRKEAFVKALGGGLRVPLDAFEVSLAPDAPGQLLRSCSFDPEATVRWRVIALTAPPGYAAALAAEGAGWRLVQLDV